MDSYIEDTIASLEYNCTCGDICVSTTGWWRDGEAFNLSDTPIQDAIDNAGVGDTICVKDGTYHENVNVTTANIVIKSENGAASTIVQALNSDDHVFEVTTDYVNISGFTVTGATRSQKAGLYLGSNVNHCNISGNAATNNEYGIYLSSSSNNELTSNSALNNNGYGIKLDISSDNKLTGNTVSNNEYGIYLSSSSNNELTSNSALNNNGCGIELGSSSNNELAGNTADLNGFGIYLYYNSSNNELTGNTASNNDWCGIELGSSSNNELTNNIANSNINDGIRLDSSYSNTLMNNSANSNINDGIRLDSSYSNTFTNNTANSNNCGIKLDDYSYSNMLTCNTANSNRYCGIDLDWSSGNTLTSNTANLNNYQGIFLWESYGNTLTGNTVNSNNCGICLTYSGNNRIYNNYFNNTNNAYDDGSNIWNITKTAGPNIIGGSWLGGNYWSDYDGIDANGDGFGDTLLPYNSNGDILIGGDRHPLVPACFAPLLSIEKSDNPNLVLPGGRLNYTIILNNTGYAAATNVTVTETYDLSVTFVSAIPAPSEGNAMWIFPALIANETKWINISVTVNPSTPIETVLHNTVNVTCDEGVRDSDTEATTVFFGAPNCTCGDICVITTGWWRDGSTFNPSDTPIQDAIDNAGAVDTICVKDGTYDENVDVDKRLTIRSDNGAASTTVNALDFNDHVFEVTVDYVSISGFTVKEATGSWKAGIYLGFNIDHCNISNNNALDNYFGIYMDESSNYSTITGNTASNNSYGIWLHYSSSNELTGNTASNNDGYGIILHDSNNNFIYNNYFNNTNNAFDNGNNIWNITMTLGGNIIGGPYLGGNYWSDYAGNDSSHNGLGDTPYNIPPDISKDYLPLVPVEPSPCFIATAAYGTPLHEDIDVLRDFRDEYLMTNPTGRTFVKIYYNASPPIADLIRETEGLGTAVREGFVKPLVYVTKMFV